MLLMMMDTASPITVFSVKQITAPWHISSLTSLLHAIVLVIKMDKSDRLMTVQTSKLTFMLQLYCYSIILHNKETFIFIFLQLAAFLFVGPSTVQPWEASVYQADSSSPHHRRTLALLQLIYFSSSLPFCRCSSVWMQLWRRCNGAIWSRW